jgi:hypothetical protein
VLHQKAIDKRVATNVMKEMTQMADRIRTQQKKAQTAFKETGNAGFFLTCSMLNIKQIQVTFNRIYL